MLPSLEFMYSTYIIVSYVYLVCYDYIPVMPTHAVSIAYVVNYPVSSDLPTWSFIYILSLLYIYLVCCAYMHIIYMTTNPI